MNNKICYCFQALLLACYLCLVNHPVYAQTEDQLEQLTTDENEEADDYYEDEDEDGFDTELFPLEPDESIFSFLDKPQEFISTEFHYLVKNTDEFFSDEKVFYETSKSYLKLTGEALYLEGGEQGYHANVKVKLRLPATQRKINLLVESNPGEDEDDAEKVLQDTPQDAVTEQSYYAGLQTTIGKKEHWQFKPSVGVKLGRTSDFYTRFRLTRKVPFGNNYFEFREALYWFNSRGWESDTTGEFNVPMLDDLLFRSTTGYNWQRDLNLVSLRQIFSLTHKLSERRAISYQAGFFGNDDPTMHTTHYTLTTHYRQNLHQNYLFLDLIPKITYLKEYDFRAEYSLNIRLEIVFKG